MVTASGALGVPIGVAGNVSFLGETATIGTSTPTPESVALSLLGSALLTTVRSPLSMPPDAGLNATVTWQLAPPASVVPQLLLTILKLLLTVMLVISSVCEPAAKM